MVVTPRALPPGQRGLQRGCRSWLPVGLPTLTPISGKVKTMRQSKLFKRLSAAPLLALSMLAAASLLAPLAASAAELVPLEMYWSKQRGDNVTCGTEACRRAQVNTGGYRYLRVEGCVFDRRIEGTVASARSRREQENAGTYRYVRVEGYIFKKRMPKTVPLWLYWYGKRSDNATVASSEGIRDQGRTKGMQRVRVEGYVYPASAC